MNAVKWKAMEAEPDRSGPSTSSSPAPATTRRTLSDCSNYVIPTSTILGRLSASLSSKLSLHNPNSSKPNSNHRSEPYDSTAGDKPPDSHSTRSNTSVGSSNYNEKAPNPSTAETPIRVSATNRGKENKDVFEHATTHSGRKSVQRTKQNGTEIALPFTSPATRKSRRIAREVNTQKTKDNGRVDALPSSCGSLMEKTRARRKEVDLPPTFASLVKQVDSSKASSNYKKNALNPKTADQSLPSTPLRVSTANRGKQSEEVFEPAIIYSRRQSAEDNGTEVVMPFTSPVNRKSKRIAREETMQKTKYNGKSGAGPPSFSFIEKTRAKRKDTALPPSFASLEKHVANSTVPVASTNTPSQGTTRSKRNATSVPLSCPPLLKTKKTRSESSESPALSKSCEVPNAKHKKKRAHSLPEQDVSNFTLPADFIEQKKKYFQEIDDFELVEEEASEDELE